MHLNICLLVGWSVIISEKSGKLHYHAPIVAIVLTFIYAEKKTRMTERKPTVYTLHTFLRGEIQFCWNSIKIFLFLARSTSSFVDSPSTLFLSFYLFCANM